LNKLLSFKSNLTFSTKAAQVIGRDSSNWLSTLIIDKGEKAGINIGMPVISDTGLVGKIVEVSKSTSRVLLINDPNLKVAALVQDSRDEGMVSGSLGGTCRMYFLSLDSEVKINDVVVTSGLGGVFPKGLLIGRVVDVDLDSTGLMKNCSIKPATNLSRIEEVLVILK
jgi:rod shape-determining protein MreC